jgi:cytochrome c5
MLAVLWLLLALLPLRGWTAAVMHLPTADAAMASAMPCHASAEDDAHAPHVAPAGEAMTCTLCDLCHGVVAWTAPATAAPAPLAEAPPSAGLPSALQVVAKPLYRPPRD